jgi:uncharacterized membrane protein YcaP (DUF421 family)
LTVAIGSVIASSILTKDPSLYRAVIALGSFYALQMSIAKLRGIFPLINELVDNQPILLMKGSNILDENLKITKVSTYDLRAKLREANVTDLSQVKDVVMETTGDLSVLHGKDASHKIVDYLLHKFKGWNET